MKKIIILALGVLAFGSVKAQSAFNDSAFISRPSKLSIVPIITPLESKEEFNKYLDSFRKDSIQFIYQVLDKSDKHEGLVFEDFNKGSDSQERRLGTARYIFEDKYGFIHKIIIEGDDSIMKD